MSWRRLLLAPRLTWYGLPAPPGPGPGLGVLRAGETTSEIPGYFAVVRAGGQQSARR